ncbi:MAG: response regulator transcription factor [Pigmentiphaga sp.]|nr:response regulator transcription factor [Pigmentiphaga sp.]
MRILIVEDDSKVSYWLVSKLQACGHQCTLVDNGRLALDTVAREAFDVMVLDRMLPVMDGMEVLAHLRDRRRPSILVLSAVDQPDDRVAGLRAGADDYLGKPFHFSELLARLDVLARRGASAAELRVLNLRDLSMDVLQREVRRGGQRLDLTDKEFQLLRVLLEHSGQVVTRSMLLQKVWGYEFDPQTNLIDVHVSKLRAKLDDKRFGAPLLRTVRSVGYALG